MDLFMLVTMTTAEYKSFRMMSSVDSIGHNADIL